MFIRRGFHALALALATILAVAALIGTATAQTASVTKTAGATATLSWTAPTGYTDGTSIIAGTAVTYSVYSGATKVATGLTALTWTSAALTVGTPCWAVTATVAGLESAQTPQVCVSVVAPTPNPPAGLTVH